MCTFLGSRRLSPDEAAGYLFRRVVSQRGSSGVVLQNGARLCLNVGSHPEYATPECDNLLDLVAHAAHQAAATASSRGASHPPAELQKARGILRTIWGQQEGQFRPVSGLTGTHMVRSVECGCGSLLMHRLPLAVGDTRGCCRFPQGGLSGHARGNPGLAFWAWRLLADLVTEISTVALPARTRAD